MVSREAIAKLYDDQMSNCTDGLKWVIENNLRRLVWQVEKVTKLVPEGLALVN